MKADDLYEGMGELDEKVLEQSELGKRNAKALEQSGLDKRDGKSDTGKHKNATVGKVNKKRKGILKYLSWGIAAVAVLAMLIGISYSLMKGIHGTKAYAIAQAEYPEVVQNPYSKEFPSDEARKKAFQEWQEYLASIQMEPGYESGVEPYLERSLQAFLEGAGDENFTFSPLNIYMALAMLAETTDGETREEILKALGQTDLEPLRKQAQSIWKANYKKDDTLTCTMATSLWLNEGIPYEIKTLECVKENYFASSFQGKMGDKGYDEAYRDWLNEQTGGFLKKQLSDAKLAPDTEEEKSVLMLATTIYFKAKWPSEFLKSNTKPRIFHAPSGDREQEFMHRDEHTYYWGEHFGAVVLPLHGNAMMWIMLPDEDASVGTVLQEDSHELMELFGSLYGKYEYQNFRGMKVHLALPKFDISSRMDLKGGLEKLGIRNVFQQGEADFTPLLKDGMAKEWGVYVTKAQHDARVSIDEEGVIAAAVTQIGANGGGMPPEDQDEIDFIVDRPFLFVITGDMGLPLFAGVVNEP